MNDPVKYLSEAPKGSGLTTILRAWRLLLIGFLAGGLLGAAAFGLFPPLYRAEAVVVLDQNLEKSYPGSEDREVFYFLERETNRLEELAWSDDVLQRVVDEIRDISIIELRNGSLQLSQPSDGGWRFYGFAADAKRAEKIADAWADAFEKEVRTGVTVAQSLEAAQDRMKTLTETCGGDQTVEMAALQEEIDMYSHRTYGINPLVEVYRSQEKDMLVERVSSQGLYIFAGSMTGLVLMIIAGVFFYRGEPDEN